MNRYLATLMMLSAWSSVAATASAQTFPEPECRDNEDDHQVCDSNIFVSRCVAEGLALDCKKSGRCTDVTTVSCPSTLRADGTVQYCCKACAPVVNSNVPPSEDPEGRGETANRAVCAQKLACAGPPPPPSFGIISQYCGGLHSMQWSQSPGSLRYQVQAKPRATYPWDQVPETLNYPGIIVDVGGDQLGCDGDANGDFYARARACNACGCSAWSAQYGFTYFRAECR
jgi:hypothetical protein